MVVSRDVFIMLVVVDFVIVVTTTNLVLVDIVILWLKEGLDLRHSWC